MNITIKPHIQGYYHAVEIYEEGSLEFYLELETKKQRMEAAVQLLGAACDLLKVDAPYNPELDCQYDYLCEARDVLKQLTASVK